MTVVDRDSLVSFYSLCRISTTDLLAIMQCPSSDPSLEIRHSQTRFHINMLSASFMFSCVWPVRQFVLSSKIKAPHISEMNQYTSYVWME